MFNLPLTKKNKDKEKEKEKEKEKDINNKTILEKRRQKYYDDSSDEEDREGKIQMRQEEIKPKDVEVVKGTTKGLKSSEASTKRSLRKQLKTEKDSLEVVNISPVRGGKVTRSSTATAEKEKQPIITEPVVTVERKETRGRKKKVVVEPEVEKEELKTDGEAIANKLLLKKKRLRKSAVIDKEDIDDSKIISEVNIDYGKDFAFKSSL